MGRGMGGVHIDSWHGDALEWSRFGHFECFSHWAGWKKRYGGIYILLCFLSYPIHITFTRFTVCFSLSCSMIWYGLGFNSMSSKCRYPAILSSPVLSVLISKTYDSIKSLLKGTFDSAHFRFETSPQVRRRDSCCVGSKGASEVERG